MKIKALLGGAAVVALLLMGSSVVGSVPAQAQSWQDCRDRIDHAEKHLAHMKYRFGQDDDRTREAHDDVVRIRDWCYSHNRDRWDEGWRGRHHDRWDRRDHRY